MSGSATNWLGCLETSGWMGQSSQTAAGRWMMDFGDILLHLWQNEKNKDTIGSIVKLNVFFLRGSISNFFFFFFWFSNVHSLMK